MGNTDWDVGAVRQKYQFGFDRGLLRNVVEGRLGGLIPRRDGG